MSSDPRLPFRLTLAGIAMAIAAVAVAGTIDTTTVFSTGGCEFKWDVNGIAYVSGPCLAGPLGAPVAIGTPVSGLTTGSNPLPFTDDAPVTAPPVQLPPVTTPPAEAPEPRGFLLAAAALAAIVAKARR
jgi:hypothetical protein